jgi:hypothetical protein
LPLFKSILITYNKDCEDEIDIHRSSCWASNLTEKNVNLSWQPQ